MSRRVVSRYRESVVWTLLVLVSVSVSETGAGVTPSLNNTSNSSTGAPDFEVPAATAAPAIPAASSAASTVPAVPAGNSGSSREVNKKPSPLGESLQLVANQLSDTLLHSHNAHAHRHDFDETSHAGVAVPVSLDELETESMLSPSSSPSPSPSSSETSTLKKGISTWILLSNPSAANSTTTAATTTEPTKLEEPQKKKPTASKNKNKRPQTSKPSSKRPLIASANKSDLVAGGSAINDNQLNKLKDTVLSNVHKNKNSSTQKTTTPSLTTTTTIIATTLEEATTKKDDMIKTSTLPLPVIKVTSKPSKKKNKIKQKVTSTTTTEVPVINESALLPMEAKEQEIELEISTPATTTKKPKRTSSKKKKNKTKKRKTTATKVDATAVKVTETKKPSKTKTSKPAKKPENPITTQIFSYLSREVMPSVGVGVIGLAGLVGIASYFLYPFATPVRRTLELDKKDDLYRHNAEEYASEGNGQAEEEMLGTVLAGMPAHSKHSLNPYIGQMAQNNPQRYPQKKEQDLKYRHVASSYESPNYNMHYPQQKTGIAHGAVYSNPSSFSAPQYETRHKFTTESKYSYDNSAYTPYPTPSVASADVAAAIEPIYATSQTGPTAAAQYNNEVINSVVYGVKPAAETDFKPVYPFEGQVFGDTTSNPINYPSTSMYLGSNSETDLEDAKYSEEDNEAVDNKFVVGNVPKELVDSATPAVVPEHGPRKLNRKKRDAMFKKRSIIDRIEEILRAVKAENGNIEMSNEIDETLLEKMKIESEANENPVAIEIVTESALEKETETERTSVAEYYFVNRMMITSELPTETIENVSTFPIEEPKKEENPVKIEPHEINNVDYTTLIYGTDSINTDTNINSIASDTSDDVEIEKSSSTTISNELNEIDYTTKSKEIYKQFSDTNKNTIDEVETSSTFSKKTSNVPQETIKVDSERLDEVIPYSENKTKDSNSSVKQINGKKEANDTTTLSPLSSSTPSDLSSRSPLGGTSTITSSRSSTFADTSASSPASSLGTTPTTIQTNSPANISITGKDDRENISQSSLASTTESITTSTDKRVPPRTQATTPCPPPANAGSTFLRLLRQLIEAKYQLGLNILRSTSESLNRYLDMVHGSLPAGSHTVPQSRKIKEKLKEKLI